MARSHFARSQCSPAPHGSRRNYHGIRKYRNAQAKRVGPWRNVDAPRKRRDRRAPTSAARRPAPRALSYTSAHFVQVQVPKKSGGVREVLRLERVTGTGKEFMAEFRSKLKYFVKHAWQTEFIREQRQRLWANPPKVSESVAFFFDSRWCALT